MDVKEYIDSGVLELYVCGALSEKESEEVSTALHKHPEITKEVEEIEKGLQDLAIGVAPYNPHKLLERIKNKINTTTTSKDVVTIDRNRHKNQRIIMYLSMAASLALLIGLFTLYNDNRSLEEKLKSSQREQSFLETEIANAREDFDKSQELLSVLRDRDIQRIPLAGQEVAPEAYVNVYWDDNSDKAYIDAQGLPEPPPGKVYQVWSLTLDPLTPTSIGLLDEFSEDENKIFTLENPNESQAFGITLEPEGGSKTPTMEQLYTLGTTES